VVPQRIERDILIDAPVDNRLTVVESGFRDLSGSEDENQGHVDSHRRGWRLELGELQEYAAQLPAER